MIKTSLANVSPSSSPGHPYPRLSIYSIAKHLSNPAAVNALLQINTELWLTSLTENPNLSALQLEALLSSESEDVTIRVALRADLPLSVIWQIIKDPRTFLRYAFIFERPYSSLKNTALPEELLQHIIEQPWFSSAYANRLLGFKGLTAKQIKVCKKKVDRATYREAYQSDRAPERESVDTVKLHLRENEYPISFIYDTILVTDAMDAPIPMLLDTIAPAYHPGNKLLELSVIQSFEELTTNCGVEFFTTLFSLLDGWQHSLSDLLSVTTSLLTAPTPSFAPPSQPQQ